MRRFHTRWLAVAAVAALIVTTSSFAGKYNRVLKIGQKAPPWTGLIGVDGKQHSLSDLDKAKAVAVVFTCNSCPVAVAYQDRLIQLTKDFKKIGVEVVAINVNTNRHDAIDAMKVRAREKKFNFPYLYDPTQKIARQYGATVTPHVFLLDKERKVFYMGAIDDNQNPSKVKHKRLRNAVGFLLSGPETKQFGCTIKYNPS